MKRTESRELAFKTIYSKFFNPSNEDIYDGANAENLAFVKTILSNFASHYSEINEIITAKLKNYTLDRVNKIDLAIIIVAVIELKFIKETPKEVVINEAVNLAKKYSTEKSHKFINGLLADIIKEWKSTQLAHLIG